MKADGITENLRESITRKIITRIRAVWRDVSLAAQKAKCVLL